LFEVLAGGRSEANPLLSVGEQFPECSRESYRIWVHASADVGGDVVGSCAKTRGNDGESGTHGLDNRDPIRLAFDVWLTKNVCRKEQVTDVASLTEKGHSFIETVSP